MYEDGDPGGAPERRPRARRRRGVLFWIVVVVGALLFGGFVVRVGQGLYERLRPAPIVEVPPTAVQVIEMQPRPFERAVPISGSLEPVHSVDVFPKLGGKVIAVYAGLGDAVDQGDRLATVESVEYELQSRQARVGLAMAEEAVELAERSFQRLERVREQSNGFGLSEQAYEQAEIEVQGARTQRDQARLQADLAGQMVANATMRAPVTGVVTRVHAQLGAMVGSEYPAFHVDDTSELVLRCEVGDLDLPLIASGQAVRLWTDTLPDRTVEGTVRAVSPTLDAWTRRAPVEIAVPNPAGQITGNLFARGEIIVDVDLDAFVLPREVVRRTVDGAWVQVAHDGIVREIEVRVLAESERALSVGGLEPGDRVIVPGAEHLADGEPVVIVESPEPLADVAQ